MKPMELWPVDPLVKVFPDDDPPKGAGRAIEVLAARGAVESAQFALRTGRDCPDFEVRIEPPRSESGARIEDIRWRRVEFVPVRRPAWYLEPGQRLRPYPSFFPDPLIPPDAFDAFYKPPVGSGMSSARLPGGMTAPVWLTIRVPEDAAPGTYRGEVKVRTKRGSKSLPLIIAVSPARVPKERTLKLTQWFSAKNIAEAAGIEMWSDEHWDLLAAWGRDLAEHRSNVVITPLAELLILSRDAGRHMSVDFSRFDRWVDTFAKAGAIGCIEGSHLAGRGGNWESGFVLTSFPIRRSDGCQEDTKGIAVESPKAQQFIEELLRPLAAHLKERGWLKTYYQHMADEPIPKNAASYRALSDAVKRAAPELVRMDATMADESLLGTVNVWCPQSQEAEKHLDLFRQRQALGEEVWHYTCLAPSGAYPNRFVSQPLLGTRALHWFNHTAGLTGYLHWGFNHWRGFGTSPTPYCDTESTTAQGFGHLPAGDTHLVYPGPKGAPLDSIRHEAVLEGVQDYELLRVAGAFRPKDAMRIARSVVPSLKRYEKSPARFRAARRKLLALAAEAQER